MKKVVSFLLAFVLTFSCLTVTVNAENDVVVMGQMYSKKLHNASNTYHKQTAENVLSQYVDLSTFTQVIMAGVSNCQEYIDVSAYNMPTSVINVITDYLFYGVPQAFNINQMGCSYDVLSGNIQQIVVYYNAFADTATEYNTCIGEMSAAADKLLSGIKGNSALSDEQKLLLIHDRLIMWNTYGYPSNTTTIEAHTAYGALGNRMSVCQGYAMAYMYLLNQVGVDSYYCSSDALNHGWNIVILNGKKYHVDVTWDDPIPDRLGRVEHDNFLRSSNGIYATGHKATDYDTSPSDTKYDNYFWQNSNSEFQLVDNEIYYINSDAESIKRYSDNATICGVEAIWSAGYNSYWNGNFSCLSSDGKSLFYSQPKAIYRFDLTTNKSEAIYTPNTSEYESIFGFAYQDETIICDISDSPNYIVQQITQSYKHNYEPQIIYGDANGDGRVNGRDYGMLMQYLNGWAIEIDLTAADVTGDGKVNGRDYGLIMQYLNGWDVTLSPKS